jgi:hypothetical protein
VNGREPFDVAWDRIVKPEGPLLLTSMPDAAWGVVLWSSDSSARTRDRAAFLGTRQAWRRAYERRPPTTRECAASQLLPR